MRPRSVLLALLLPLATPAASAQMTLPIRASDEVRPSPNAVVGQTVGTTDVLITYGRPSKRERVIFGELVPYGEVWRTGANEATTFSVSKDVRIEGQPLSAGRYSLHSIPTEDGWTLIFNHAAEQWGSYEYDATQDALRVEVEAEEGDDVEMMSFWFEDVTDSSAEVVLAWDEMRVPFTIEAMAPAAASE